MIGNYMTLEFKVDKQTIIRLDEQKVVEKSQDYVYAHFIFSEDWKGLDKYALMRPYDVAANYKVEIGKNNTIKIPYDLVVFPGFIMAALGTDGNEHTKITTDGVDVDVEPAPIIDGDDALAVRYVSSANDTITVDKISDTLDLGIDLDLKYVDNVLNLYAYTYNEKSEEGEPIKKEKLLTSILLDDVITSIEPELEHTDDEQTTYRNFVITQADGTVIRFSIDNFFNEIRTSLANEVTRATSVENNLDSRLSKVEEDYLTSQDKQELTSAINNEASVRQEQDNLTNQNLNTLKTNIEEGNIALIEQADLDAIFPPLA